MSGVTLQGAAGKRVPPIISVTGGKGKPTRRPGSVLARITTMILRAASAILATLTALALTAGTATASPAPLKCSAAVTVARPADYSKEYVTIKTAGDAKVTAAAHYKTTTRWHSAEAAADGRVSILFRISDATPGYKVKVTVTVSLGGHSGSCSTSFTPKR